MILWLFCHILFATAMLDEPLASLNKVFWAKSGKTLGIVVPGLVQEKPSLKTEMSNSPVFPAGITYLPFPLFCAHHKSLCCKLDHPALYVQGISQNKYHPWQAELSLARIFKRLARWPKIASNDMVCGQFLCYFPCWISQSWLRG